MHFHVVVRPAPLIMGENLLANSAQQAHVLSLLYNTMPAVAEFKALSGEKRQQNVEKCISGPLFLSGMSVLQLLSEANESLQRVEEECSWNDFEDLHISQTLMADYKSALVNLRREFALTGKVTEATKAAWNALDVPLCSFLYPNSDTGKYKVTKARQLFLNMIAETLGYLHTSKGLHPMWVRDCTNAVAVHRKQFDASVPEEERKGAPIRMLEYYHHESDEFQNQFSYIHFRVVITHTRELFDSFNHGEEYSKLSFVALACSRYFVKLRQDLTRWNQNRTLEMEQTVAKDLVEFGYFFGKVKAINYKDIVKPLRDEPSRDAHIPDR